MDATQEQWRPVVGYEGSYEVSDHGRVRSLERMVRGRYGGPSRVNAKELSPATKDKGYKSVQLWNDTKLRGALVHRLVAEAFIGPCPEGLEVCHFDGNAANNHISNLRYDTRRANAQDILRLGHNFNANKTHCVNGHEFTEQNTHRSTTTGRRQCKRCRADRAREARRKQREERDDMHA